MGRSSLALFYVVWICTDHSGIPVYVCHYSPLRGTQHISDLVVCVIYGRFPEVYSFPAEPCGTSVESAPNFGLPTHVYFFPHAARKAVLR